jgi:hypothetical protein
MSYTLIRSREVPDWMIPMLVSRVDVHGDISATELIARAIDCRAELEPLLRLCDWGVVEIDGRENFAILHDESLSPASLWAEAQWLARFLSCAVTRVVVQPADEGADTLVYLFSMRQYVPA